MNDTQSWNDLADLENYSPDNNLLIIDGNNLAYRWIGRRNYDDFADDYVQTIKSLSKSYKARRTIVVYDFGKSYYRMALHEEYKATRKKPSTEEEQKKYDDFFNCLNGIIEILPDERIEFHKYRGVEADDLIAFFVENIQEYYDHLWIISSDKDLYQLINEKVSIFNLYSRREISEDSLLEDFGLTPEEYTLAKIIQGDSGDNIKGIAGIGEKRSAELAREYQTFPKLLDALPIKRPQKYIKNLNEGKDTLILAEKLINLPKYYEAAIKAGKEGDRYWEVLNEKLMDG